MTTASSKRIRFRTDWKTSVFVILLFPLLFSLGLWQLDREQEKRDILRLYQQRQAAPALDLADAWSDLMNAKQAAYQQVIVRGKLMADYRLLLDNQVLNGVVGYNLIQGVELTNTRPNRYAWINRGWLAAPKLRSERPDIPSPNGVIQLSGTVYVPQGKPFLLQEQSIATQFNKQRLPLIQAVDMAQLRPLLAGDATFPHLIRLNPESDAALRIDWPPVNTRPEKHRGYAIQWFAMAGVLLLFYLYRSIEVGVRRE